MEVFKNEALCESFLDVYEKSVKKPRLEVLYCQNDNLLIKFVLQEELIVKLSNPDVCSLFIEY